MRNKIATLLLAVFAVCAVNMVSAAEFSDMIAYSEDFSGGTPELSAISASENMYITADLTNEENKAFVLESGRDRSAEIIITANENEKLSFEGKILRQYGADSNPYWDIRVMLKGNAGETMLASFGQGIYLGENWEYASDYYMTPNVWVPFRVAINKIGTAVESELFLSGRSYGKSISTFMGELGAIKLYSANTAGNGNIYLDDLIIVKETEKMAEFLGKIEDETATEEECTQWLGFIAQYYELGVMKEYYNKIYSFANENGYIGEFSITSAYPENESMIYAGSTLEYVFSELLGSGAVATVKKGDDSISAKTTVSGNKLTVSAELEPDSEYQLEISGIKNTIGTTFAFEPVTFTTNIVPVVSVKSGMRYEMGQVISWSDGENSVTTASLESEDKSIAVENGDIFAISGDVTLVMITEKDSQTCEERINLTVIHNDVPEATEVKILGTPVEGEFIEGAFVYFDKDGDAKDEENTKLEWYYATEAGGEYTKLADGNKIEVEEEIFNLYLKFAVTPVSVKAPVTGETAWSEPLAMPFAPVVSNVEIKGNAKENNTISGYYDYYDANGDAELTEETVKEWIDGDGNVIGNGNTLELEKGMAGEKIAFRVTAKTNAVPKKSETVVSEYITVTKAASGGTASSGGGGGFGYSGSNSGSSKKQPTTPVITPPVTKPEPPETPAVFEDIKGHWAESFITELKEKNIINGVSETSFNPDGQVSRSQMLAMIMRGAEISAEEYTGIFADVKAEDWYSGYVQAAIAKGVISEAEYFNPDRAVTREETAKLISMFTKDYSGGEEFADSDNISEWAKAYVDAASAAGIFKGDTNGSFRPRDVMTRAEAAAIISRILESGKAVVK